MSLPDSGRAHKQQAAIVRGNRPQVEAETETAMDGNTQEPQFLPAALEVERTPPRPAARWIAWSIMGFFAITVAWSTFGHVDIVGIAQGKIVPSGRTKRVQPLVAANVRAIHVEEGQRVQAGDVLVELDDTKARADLERLYEEHRRVGWDEARLQALLTWLATGLRPQLAPEYPAKVDARIEHEYRAFEAERHALEDERRRNRAERTTIEAEIARIAAMLPLLTERVEAVRSLETKSLAPRANWLELEGERVELAHERDVFKARLGVVDAAFNNTTQRLKALGAQTEARWRHELAEVETRRASYTQEIRKAERRVAEHRLTAPVAGTVQQLGINTVGGVVSPAEQLMLIVPDEGPLHIEAWLPNKDIGFVEPGQDAVIKVETFPFTKYGTVDGTVRTVSHDAVADDNLGLVYLAQVEMAKRTMWVKGKEVNLTPGMAVTVEVDLGERRIIEFLLAPLLRYRDEGLTER